MEPERITIIAAKPKVSIPSIVLLVLILAVLYFFAAITIIVAMYVIGFCAVFLAANYGYVKVKQKLSK